MLRNGRWRMVDSVQSRRHRRRRYYCCLLVCPLLDLSVVVEEGLRKSVVLRLAVPAGALVRKCAFALLKAVTGPSLGSSGAEVPSMNPRIHYRHPRGFACGFEVLVAVEGRQRPSFNLGPKKVLSKILVICLKVIELVRIFVVGRI